MRCRWPSKLNAGFQNQSDQYHMLTKQATMMANGNMQLGGEKTSRIETSEIM
jgi:hypothetical protein